ncbi:MAG: leucyl/phenylalanyl-tRNA--protein transferase [Pseudomonadota bacterium]
MSKFSKLCYILADTPPDGFPPVDRAMDDPDGLLAAGGDLSTERLLCAYQRGIFPWYDDDKIPVLWWSPKERMILRPDRFHVSRSLGRYIRHSNLHVAFNQNFEAVVRACAAPRHAFGGTWITDNMFTAYLELHQQGFAHSVEVYADKELIGGLYGVGIDRVFFGESMFSGQTNGSKIALLALCRFMHSAGMPVLDCQLCTPHLASLGAEALERQQFVQLLGEFCAEPVRIPQFPAQAQPVLNLLKSAQ